MKRINRSIFRTFFILSTATIGAVIVTTDADAVQRQRMTARQCSPLSEDNFAACCVAINRTKILTPAQIKMCPPLTTASIGAGTGRHDRSDSTASGPMRGGGKGGGSKGGGDNGGGGQDPGKGDQDNGKGNQDGGKGHQDNGKGGQDGGKGHQDNDKGNQDGGKGHQDNDKGNQDGGKGHQDNNKGDQDGRGKGGKDKGGKAKGDK
ncbi:hypothetical protein [Sinorhizobium meliloti]|uniref:hypothetical protein n=1 Tax=Rhizobium meliloti TaxID=382 RepID=UPI000FD96937|nr:hypothetical protein [Sinorhizobium meliloti]RVL12030.1 hypothetical protein CN149_15805 [Sinorhizobium meliloti]RVQ59875.1 hypothetical protein CN245_06780 [Sinorhizobium meliloti]